MKEKLLPFFAFLLFALSGVEGPLLSSAQQLPPAMAEYRSTSNEVYWGNRKPLSSYWQQDVYYQISAEILPDSNRVDANLTLTYYNNSPDTLNEVFFHLYQNAFQPESYYDQKLEDSKRKAKYGKYESQKKGTIIHSLEQNGQPLKVDLDNTIARVNLGKVLLPNSFTTFSIRFSTWWDNGSEGRRMKLLFSEMKNDTGGVSTVKHFDGVHWYPRISVYDRKMAWDTQQHLGYEFYGDFGVYDVSLTFPGNYVLDATGVMTNESEMLPADLRSKLDIKNFADKKWGEAASLIIPNDAPKKTWKFHAVNVHDFAFTADPTYRISETQWNGIRCIALARESHARGWQDASEFTAKVIECYSNDIGMYLYPKMICADADDGMEYPMLTLDGGSSPGYYGLIAHEVGHNWFFAMVGNNETYRAMLDEGFTQFLTSWSMNKLVSKESRRGGGEKMSTTYATAMSAYINTAYLGFDGMAATSSHFFPDGYNYRMVYYKTSTMLYNLQYVLGDEKFLGAMKHYFKKWRLAHPYVEDFRDAITEYANTDLTWFFDQWLDTDRKLDYSVNCVKTKKGGTAKIEFERKGEMQMPLDFIVISKSNDTTKYTLPNSWYSKSEPGLTVLPKWEGYELLNKKHIVEIPVIGKIKKIIIDPSFRLADINLLDNQSGCMPMKIKFSLLPPKNPYPGDWKNYRWHARPNIWWNGYSGLQIGASIQGSYMRTTGKTWLGLWYNTGLGQTESAFDPNGSLSDVFFKFSWKYHYSTPIRKFGPGFNFEMHSIFLDAMHNHGFELRKKFTRGSDDNPRFTTFFGGMNYLGRSGTANQRLNYLVYPERWGRQYSQSWLYAGVERNYPIRNGNGNIRMDARGTFFSGNADYSFLRMEAKHNFRLAKFQIKTRAFAQMIYGNAPKESRLYLSEGNPEEMMTSPFYRARGFFPEALTDNNLGRETNHLHYGGGLNLRGYSGYFAEYSSGAAAWYGSGGSSFNIEAEFGHYIKYHPAKLSRIFKLHSYLFYDAGVILRQRFYERPSTDEIAQFRSDGGIGFALDIHENHFFNEAPLTLRLDLPLFVSRPPAMENFFQARWVFGIGRAF